jgi:hypothetical protein
VRFSSSLSFADRAAERRCSLPTPRRSALLELDDIVKPLIPVNNDPSPASSPAKPVIGKKGKSTSDYTVDKDGAIIISDDSDGEGIKEEGKKVKKEGKKVKKEKGANSNVKKEKVWIEID